jgi:hypothetical protein
MTPLRRLLSLVGLVVLVGCGGSDRATSGRTPSSAPASATAPAPSATTSAPDPTPVAVHAVTTARGAAHVVLTGSGTSHDYGITCYRHPASVFLATPNIPLAVRSDGSYTDNLIPRNGGAFMYLVVDPPDSVHGQTIEYSDTPDAEHLFAQGDFGDSHGFGGSADSLQSAELRVAADGRSGRLVWRDTDGSGYTATWRCG